MFAYTKLSDIVLKWVWNSYSFQVTVGEIHAVEILKPPHSFL